jgi:hypothetical protein
MSKNNGTPFKDLLIGSEPEKVQNPISGNSCVLPPKAVAVYDLIMGGNLIGDYAIVEKGCDWFRENFPKEYMVLLD